VLRTASLDYHLPAGAVATRPAEPRDLARMLVLRRSGDRAPEHRVVRDLPAILRPGDLLVVNSTAVLPARFRGVRLDSGGTVDGLYLHRWADGAGDAPPGPDSDGPLRWAVLLKARRTRPGVRIGLADSVGNPSGLFLRVLGRAGEPSPPGTAPGAPEAARAWAVEVEGAPRGMTTPEVLARIGLTPLPPYIRQARKAHGRQPDERGDRGAYQTVFADPDQAESVAAPTAGLHFTPALLAAVEAAGVTIARVVLHVGAGTFRPVEAEFVEEHTMHAEWCLVPAETVERVGRARAVGGRVVAVGTTAARTLESFDLGPGARGDLAAWTRLLITPGYRFRNVDALLTNFHLPRSTLLALVAAFLGPGAPDTTSAPEDHAAACARRVIDAYGLALEAGYRFYSFGDAMLILP